jgi:hypothetical protein
MRVTKATTNSATQPHHETEGEEANIKHQRQG